MILIAYTLGDITSANIGHSLSGMIDFDDSYESNGMRIFKSGEVSMVELEKRTIYADELQGMLDAKFVIFAEQHSSSKQIASLTTHAEGNWSIEAPLGGKPKHLGVAAPLQMLSALNTLNKYKTESVAVTYEATHHGPLLDTPSLFVEAGGNEDALKSKTLADYAARAIYGVVYSKDIEYGKIAIGIGGTHYSSRFTSLALQGRYAFSHIMSRHYVSESDMIPSAIARSFPKPEVAVIEWNSIKASERNQVLGVLDDIGMDYVRV